MSVESGVVLSVFEKDYELLLWNEQGEITQIEGMLTIAFLVVFPCSHKDSWKQLYLIIKIPYMVNMPTKKEMFGVTKSIGEKLLDEKQTRLQLEEIVKNQNIRLEELESENKELKEKIKELGSKIDKLNIFFKKIDSVIFHETDSHACNIGPIETAHRLLERDKKRKDQIHQFENEIKKIKDENIGLKELLGKGSSGWEIISDVAIGINPFTGEKEHFNFPKGFEENRAEKLHFTDDNFYMCNFKYHPSDDNKLYSEEYDMPITLFKYLCKISKSSESKTLSIHDLNDEESLTKYILSKGGSLRGKYPIKVIRFLLKTRGKKFDIHEFDKYCGFQDNRESRRIYIKKLINWELIESTNNQRIYQNLI